MEIQKDLFDKFPKLSWDEQAAALEQIGFDPMNDADDYSGKIIDEKEWLEPDLDRLRDFFESTCDDPDERIKKYEVDQSLTQEESKDYEDYLVSEALENENHPGLFAGSLSCGELELIVVAKRTGGYNDCEAELAGVFTDWNEAILKLGGASGTLID